VWLRKALLGMTGMVILYVGLLLVGRRLRPRSA